MMHALLIKIWFALVAIFPCKCELMLQGKVIDDSSGESISYAMVDLEHAGGRMSDPSDYDGFFVIAGICPGKQTLTIQADGYHKEEVSLALPNDTPQVVVRLKPS